MTHSFVVCIDESGDQGFTFAGENLSSQWFVLSGVIALSKSVPDMTALVRTVKTDIGWHQRKALHFKDVKPDKRALVLDHVTQNRSLFRAISILVLRWTPLVGQKNGSS